MAIELTAKSGNINLLNIRGAREITVSSEKGVFIPYLGNNIVKGKAGGAYLNLSILPMRDRKWDNDYIILRSRTKLETEKKENTEILGNLQEIEGFKVMREVPPAPLEEEPLHEVTDDLEDDLDSPF